MDINRFNRFTASALHLVLSAGIALTVLAAMRLIWYPSPFFEAIDAGGLILILVGVDVTLGPLITLVIFNLKKPELRRDLLVVVALQIAALGYGIHVVYKARPVYAVFNVDRFDMVAAADIDDAELAKAARPEFRSLPWRGPEFIAAKLPDDKKETEKILFSSAGGGADIYQLPRFYLPYSDVQSVAASKARPLAELRKKPKADEAIQAFLKTTGLVESQLGYVPFRGRVTDFSVVLELKTGRIVDFLLINPY